MNLQGFDHYARLMRWHQPAGFLLLLPASLWGLTAGALSQDFFLVPSSVSYLIAGLTGSDFVFIPSLALLTVVFCLGSLIMRSAGCVVNDVWDRDLDHKVRRTKGRPLASGAINLSQALGLFTILLVLAATCILLLNPLVVYLGLLGILGTVIYPLSKRFFYIPQVVLGVVFSWGTLMAWAAVTNNLLNWDPWFLWLANFLWIVSYDLKYALYDREDDKINKINSGALYFAGNTPKVIVFLQFLVIAVLLLRGAIAKEGVWYYAILGCSTLLFLYFWHFTQGYKNEKLCLTAFRNNHWFAWLILLGIGGDHLVN